MQQELIKATGEIAGQAVASALKNTTCTITLSGVPAAVTVLGSVGLLCASAVAIVYIVTNRTEDNSASNEH